MRNAADGRRDTGSKPPRGSTAAAIILLVVVAALVATVAWPATARSADRADAERLIATVRADMEQAFEHAGQEARPVSIQFDPRHLHYDIRDPETGELIAERRLTGTAENPLRSMWVSRGHITVDETGQVSSPWWIRLRWREGDPRWLVIHRSGRIRELSWR